MKDPDKNPEGLALQGVLDDYAPEVHVDVHGIWYDGQTMWESTGTSWGGGINRSYNPRVWELIDEEAEREGFWITHGVGDFLLSVTGPIPEAQHHFNARGPNVFSVVYAYHRYHTIGMHMESGFDDSTVARIRGLLKSGHLRWHGEFYPGYPTRVIGGWVSAEIAAYGPTAAQRRRSRVELWQKLPQLQYGGIWPEPIGQVMCCCATTPAGARKCLAGKDAGSGGGGEALELVNWTDQFRGDPQFDYQSLRRFALSTKAEKISICAGGDPEGLAVAPIRNGLALRMLIPYADPKAMQILLDGHKVTESPADGYQVYHGPGTTVQVNIPPGKVRDFHVATCTYEPDVERKCGFRPEDW